MVFPQSIGAFGNLTMSAEEVAMLHNKINLAGGALPSYDWSTGMAKSNGRGSNDCSSIGHGGAIPAMSALQAIVGHGAGLPSTASGVQASSAMDLLNFAIKAMEANNNARLLPLAANSQAVDSCSSPSPILPDLAGCIVDITSRISPAPCASSLVPPVGHCGHENKGESETHEMSSRCGHSDSIRVSNLLNSSETETPSSPSCVVAGADPETFGSVCAENTKNDAVASSQAASLMPRHSAGSTPTLSSEIFAMKKGVQSRYWSDEEHVRFLEGVRQCGAHDHKGIAVYVKTRSAAQVRSHGQKFFKKLNQHKGDGLPSMTRRKHCTESVIDTCG